MGPNESALMAELDSALSASSNPRLQSILRRVVDLFLVSSNRLSNDQVALFGDVIARLSDRVGRHGLIELSARLAPVRNAPESVMDRLARSADIAVAGPILAKSNVITDSALADVAREQGPAHLAVIADRPQLGDAVTDALVDRGNADAIHKLVANQDARLSELAFVKLINRAGSDKALASALASRADLPPELEPFLKQSL